jgi:hypothetical protein
LLYNIIYRSSTKVVQINPLVSKLALFGCNYSHYVHIVNTETKTNVFWLWESYSLDIWNEMLFGGLVSRLFWIKSLGQNFVLPKGDIDLLSCPLMYSNEISIMCTVLVVELKFDIRWPRFWWCDLLSCPLMYSYEILTICTY